MVLVPSAISDRGRVRKSLEQSISCRSLLANQDVVAVAAAANQPFEMNFKRQMSEPCHGSDAVSEVPLDKISAQELDNCRRNKLNRSTYASLRIPSSATKASEEKLPTDEYLRYLSNSSIVSISHSRPYCEVPEYLRQFEMSRRGTMTGRRDHGGDAQSLPSVAAKASSTDSRSVLKRILVTAASFYRIMGLRHFVLLVILYLYWIAGMLIFYAIEAPNERQTVAETRDKLNATLESFGRAWSVDPLLLKDAYLSLLKTEGKYSGSTYYKLEERDYPLWQWTYGSAFFFSYTLFSTVGYGSIAPSTDWGRIVTIIYSAIGFPVALVIVRDLGAALLVHITRTYAKIIIRGRATCAWWKASSDRPIMLSMPVAIMFSVTVLLVTALFVMIYDSWLGPDPGLNYWYACYFCYLSYAAIGLGDIMPVNNAHAPLIAIVLLTGIPLMRVVNRVLYVQLETGMYGSLAYIERKIDRVRPSTGDNVPATVEVTAENGTVQEGKVNVCATEGRSE